MASNEDSFTGTEVAGKFKTILCQPCLNKNVQSDAEKFCSTCNEFQCTDCLKVHYTFAYMKGHKVVDANEGKNIEFSFEMKGLDRCNQHNKVLKFFCEDENLLCCSTCAIVNHRKCNSVVDVQKVVGKSASKHSSLKIKLQEVKQKVEIIINNIVSSKKKLSIDVKEIPVKIRRMRDEVIKMFDELVVFVVKEAESFQTDKLEKLTNKQSQNEEYLADIQSYIETMNNVYQHGTSLQQFIVQQKMMEAANALQTKIYAKCQSLETMTVMFDFDESLNLPPLPINDYVPGKLTLQTHLSEVVSTIVEDITTMKLTPLISVDLKRKNKKKRPPFYSGIDFLPDGRLVAVDNFNKKCFVYNEKLEKVGVYKLPFIPQSIVALSEQDVAITSGVEYCVYILRVDKSNNITLDRTYKVGKKYDSICRQDDGHYVVGTVNHATPVRILTSTGEEKDFNITFPNKIYPEGTSACTYIKKSDKIVLTDRYEDAVYIYDKETNESVAVKSDQIEGPRGASVGPFDTILVCSRNTDCIVQISQSGRILSSYNVDMKCPRSICMSPDQSFLVVTNACAGQNKLQKLKISF